jgi:hypothetical protein
MILLFKSGNKANVEITPKVAPATEIAYRDYGDSLAARAREPREEVSRGSRGSVVA